MSSRSLIVILSWAAATAVGCGDDPAGRARLPQATGRARKCLRSRWRPETAAEFTPTPNRGTNACLRSFGNIVAT